MNVDRFYEVRAAFNEECERLLGSKGHAYTRGTVDKHSNFRRTGDAIGLTPAQVLYIFMHKHWDAVTTWLKDGADPSGNVGGESIRGRLADLRNYVDLLYTLSVEEGECDPEDGSWEDKGPVFTSSYRYELPKEGLKAAERIANDLEATWVGSTLGSSRITIEHPAVRYGVDFVLDPSPYKRDVVEPSPAMEKSRASFEEAESVGEVSSQHKPYDPEAVIENFRLANLEEVQ